jgi:predicted Ser/Thr protein kinase
MDRIGKFEITGELGTGGFGKVYKALDPTVGRVVAIKVLNVQDDPVMVKRFRAEATTSANLQHKNIVTVHQFGEDRGKQFLVMEYLDGRNLHRLIKEKTPIAMLEKLQIMSQVSEGLHYAHIHDVVHRDVKPANIMWLTDGSVKVMDFGIARMMHNVGTRLTQAGSMIGTLQYMAPEQFTSDSTDARCDIWAFGVVLYEFLMGTNPFDAPNAMQVMSMVTRGDLTPILALPEHPAGLIPLMKRLLARLPDERYPTMEDAQFDLEQVILELKQTQVGSLAQNAGKLIQEERLTEALTVVRQILDLDQSHEIARQWRKELTERLKWQSTQVKVRELADEAETRVFTRDYGAALERLEEALRLDPNNSALRARLQAILSEQESVRRAASLLAEARLELQHDALTSAFEHANQAAEADPRSPEATALRDRVKSLVERREWEARRKGALSKAKGLILVQDYAAATRILQDWADRHSGDPEIQERLEEARRLQAVYAAQLKVDAAIVESKEMIRRGSYPRAIEILAGLDQRVPEVAALLTYAREQQEAEGAAALSQDEENRKIARLVADCRATLSAGSLELAAARSAELDARYPADPSVAALREEVSLKVREWREKRRRSAESMIELGRATALREAIAEVEALIANAKFLPAVAAANAALERFPNDQKLVQLRQQAQQALERPPAGGGAALPLPGESPAPDNRKMLVIAACALITTILAVILFLYGRH